MQREKCLWRSSSMGRPRGRSNTAAWNLHWEQLLLRHLPREPSSLDWLEQPGCTHSVHNLAQSSVFDKIKHTHTAVRVFDGRSPAGMMPRDGSGDVFAHGAAQSPPGGQRSPACEGAWGNHIARIRSLKQTTGQATETLPFSVLSLLTQLSDTFNWDNCISRCIPWEHIKYRCAVSTPSASLTGISLTVQDSWTFWWRRQEIKQYANAQELASHAHQLVLHNADREKNEMWTFSLIEDRL